MRTWRARRARRIAIRIVYARRNGSVRYADLPDRMVQDRAWVAKHLHDPVVRRSRRQQEAG